MTWTRESIAAMAASRGFDKLEPEHLDRWLALAQRQPSTLPLRAAVERKQDEPGLRPRAFPPQRLHRKKAPKRTIAASSTTASASASARS